MHNNPKRKPQPFELGKGGVTFVRRGDMIVGEACANTVSHVTISKNLLARELELVCTVVKGKEGITGPKLQKQFRDSPLAGIADANDWDGWVKDFSPANKDRGRPASAALTFLERKKNLTRGTLKNYASRAKKRKS